ncbi:hypothetical protein RB195_001217 [Necator americanus]|uniref:guanylate cyclase n=1 Tax=Necator americanus TaxID=51031 RepID=A0ABR1DD97_NECAM
MSSQKKERTTLSMVPDYQVGLTEGMITLLNELEAMKITVIYTEQLLDTALALAADRGESTRLISYTEDNLDKLHDTLEGVVLLLIVGEERVKALEYFFSHPKVLMNGKFIIFDDGSKEKQLRTDTADFLMDLQVLSDEFLPEHQKPSILNNFVLLQSIHGSEITKSAIMLNSTVTPGLEMSLLLCDAISLLNVVSADRLTIAAIFEKKIDGLSGPTFFSKNGVRLPYFNVFAFEMDGVLPVLSLVPSTTLCNYTESLDCKHYQINFDINSTVLPQLRWEEVEGVGGCVGGACNTTYTFLAALVIFVVVAIPLMAAFRKQRKEREIHQMSWRVAYERVLQKKRQEAALPLPGYRKISPSSTTGLSDSSGSGRISNSSPSYLNEQKILDTGIHDDNVFVKSYRQRRAVNLTRADMNLLNQLRSLKHSNVNEFVGMSLNEHSEMRVLWQYCSRNSLHHLIFEKNLHFRRTFQCSFLKHILNGLQYIHDSPIQFHGSLFLTNCVVDAFWVVKLTDFGVHNIIWDKIEHRELEDCRSVTVDELPSKYYQLSPEMLRNIVQEGRIPYGSQKADIYQLGMVIYQILFHMRPFADKSEMSSRQMVTAICQMDKGEPFYPSIPKDNGYTLRLTSVMQQCWSSKLDVRPALYAVSDAIAREFEKEEGSAKSCKKEKRIRYDNLFLSYSSLRGG